MKSWLAFGLWYAAVFPLSILHWSNPAWMRVIQEASVTGLLDHPSVLTGEAWQEFFNGKGCGFQSWWGRQDLRCVEYGQHSCCNHLCLTLPMASFLRTVQAEHLNGNIFLWQSKISLNQMFWNDQNLVDDSQLQSQRCLVTYVSSTPR